MRIAATICLLREGAGGQEVFMIERSARIRFAGGALVFPGGKVDEEDRSDELLSRCDGLQQPADWDRGACVAALREAFEEAGLLLARREGQPQLLNEEELKALTQARSALLSGQRSFLSILEEHQLRLACEQVLPFTRWMTPELSPRQYDTYFFLAPAPNDQRGAHDGKEAVDSLWLSPQEALRQAHQGERRVIFPTRMNLRRLNDTGSVIDTFEACRQITPPPHIRPTMAEREGEMYLEIPETAGYPATSEPLVHILKEEGHLAK